MGRLLTSRDLLAYLSKKNFPEFAATLPHIAQNAFVQGVLGAVAATRSVAANGILAQNAAKKSLILMKNQRFWQVTSLRNLPVLQVRERDSS